MDQVFIACRRVRRVRGHSLRGKVSRIGRSGIGDIVGGQLDNMFPFTTEVVLSGGQRDELEKAGSFTVETATMYKDRRGRLTNEVVVQIVSGRLGAWRFMGHGKAIFKGQSAGGRYLYKVDVDNLQKSAISGRPSVSI